MSEPVVHFVMGETGEGNSWISWVVGYAHNRKSALQLANAANAVISIKYREWMGSDIDFNANFLDEMTNPFDPNMKVAPPGVKYTVHHARHIGDLVNVQADENGAEATESGTGLSEDLRRVPRSSIGAIQQQDALRPLRSSGSDSNAGGEPQIREEDTP